MKNAVKPLFAVLEKSDEYKRLRDELNRGAGPVSVFGLGEAERLHISAALADAFVTSGKTLLYITPSLQSARRLSEEFSGYLENILLFPMRETPLNAHSYVQSQELTAKRMKVIMNLIDEKPCFIIAPVEALMQRMCAPEVLAEETHTVRIGMTVSPISLLKRFIDAGYERTALCEGRGQVALRGGYLDVFPVTSDNPVRIEFFDDEIDSLRLFDPVSQRSTENISAISIPPASEIILTREMRQRGIAALRNNIKYEFETQQLRDGGMPANALSLISVFCNEEISIIDYLPSDAVIVLDEPARVEESAKYSYTQFMQTLSEVLQSGEGHELQSNLMDSTLTTLSKLDRGTLAMLFALTRSYPLIRAKSLVKFDTRPIARYIPGDDAIKNDIGLWKQKGFTVLIYAGARAQTIADTLSDMGIIVPVVKEIDRELVQGEQLIFEASLPRGFEYPALRLAFISEYELFGAEYRQNLPIPKKAKSGLALYELEEGDLIVHEVYGIGRFAGVKTLTVEGKTRDYIELVYQGDDKLFLPTDRLDKVQKYIGGEEDKQKLSKLGSGEWQKTVAGTRASVKKLAFDLIKLYGERSRRKGFKFSPDNEWQKRLEMSFPYNETPDQITSIREIKKDMESDKIMDRLLCGDVGYGKTEVALRAAFKCAMDGKQCAILVPTTVLAQQHYNTLSSRYAGFPVKVEMLSRFRTPAEQADIKKRLGEGLIDIIIGTHALLSKSVKFHDLGLLIIDEEHRFGVNHKEQIKALKNSVDVLTLSATPIPRTLHMSMSGIRDMSVIETPPEARYPVQTFVTEYSDALAREAILKEIGRDGQVYFVYNNVASMPSFAEKLGALVPEARIVYANGQMNERLLEKTMLAFMNHEFDVLLCSTIIESGLDIANANTMIIYDADCFGLSQLYQLRGRVGRGLKLGYAYFTFKQNKVLSETAFKRLTAIREFTQFGSGFRIALRDLEIRGAGEVLGAEQHGHIAQVGYEMYCRLINAAIKEAKGEKIEKEFDTAMEVPVDAYIPAKYIPREQGRMAMYRRIAAIKDIEDLRDVQDEFIDRYGDIPKSVQNLMDIALLKAKASRAGIISLSCRPNEARFVFDNEAPIDTAKLFANINNMEGASFTGGENTGLIVQRKHKTVEEMFRIAVDTVETLLTFTYNKTNNKTVNKTDSTPDNSPEE